MGRRGGCASTTQQLTPLTRYYPNRHLFALRYAERAVSECWVGHQSYKVGQEGRGALARSMGRITWGSLTRPPPPSPPTLLPPAPALQALRGLRVVLSGAYALRHRMAHLLRNLTFHFALEVREGGGGEGGVRSSCSCSVARRGSSEQAPLTSPTPPPLVTYPGAGACVG